MPVRIGTVVKDNSPAHILVDYGKFSKPEPEFPENMEVIPPVEQLAELNRDIQK